MTTRDELETRNVEFEYVKEMAQFFKTWIRDSFGRDFEIKCDQMVTERTNIMEKPGIHTLLRDHRERGESIWHFYLANFRPFWTDSLSEGYHSENMCMTMWLKPNDNSNSLFLAEKNCIAVSYEIAHELLRQAGIKRSVDIVNNIWAKHFSGAQAFNAYDSDHKLTSLDPKFLTLDPSDLT